MRWLSGAHNYSRAVFQIVHILVQPRRFGKEHEHLSRSVTRLGRISKSAGRLYGTTAFFSARTYHVGYLLFGPRDPATSLFALACRHGGRGQNQALQDQETRKKHQHRVFRQYHVCYRKTSMGFGRIDTCCTFLTTQLPRIQYTVVYIEYTSYHSL